MCISELQNSRTQGPLIREYKKFYHLRPGDKFVVRMSSCDKLTPRAAHDSNGVASEHVSFSKNSAITGDHVDWVPDLSRISKGFYILPIGNASAGRYNGTLHYSSSASFRDIYVVDGDGYAYWEHVPNSDSYPLEFSVNEEDDIVIAAAALTSTSVSASFTATFTPAAAVTSASSGSEGVVLPVVFSSTPMAGLLLVTAVVAGILASTL